MKKAKTKPKVPKTVSKPEPLTTNGLQEWCQATTLHGIIDCKNAKSWPDKCMWAFLIFSSLCLMTYEIQQVVSEFINQEKWTTKIYEARSEDMKFPSIVICNFNRLSRKKAAQYNFTGRLMSYFFSQFHQKNYVFWHDLTEEDVENFEKWRNFHGFETWESIFEKIGSASCRNTVAAMKIGDFFYLPNDTYLCQSQDIMQRYINGSSNDRWYVALKMVYTRTYGQCVQLDFNPETVYFTDSGVENGVTLYLDPEVLDYVESPYFNFLDEGFALQPLALGGVHQGDWINAPTGNHFSFAMQKRRVILKQTNSDLYKPPCTKKPHLNILPDRDYSRTTCRLDCELGALVELCGCVPLIQANQHRTCGVGEHHQCLQKLRAVFDEIRSAVDECKSSCMDPCESETILVTASSSRFPARMQVKRIQEILDQTSRNNSNGTNSIQEISDGCVVVDFYFKDMEIQVVERFERVTVHQLISNLGGQLGLWVGMSVITIYQAIVYCCRSVRQRVSNKLS